MSVPCVLSATWVAKMRPVSNALSAVLMEEIRWGVCPKHPKCSVGGWQEYLCHLSQLS